MTAKARKGSGPEDKRGPWFCGSGDHGVDDPCRLRGFYCSPDIWLEKVGPEVVLEVTSAPRKVKRVVL